ncbi:hypothetical protein Nepgr_010776 [Nepenthes gracilis]|uniref:Uncharacterized protein n=1 Tax=Nepenthes gracilis TaxID=150966 RepID=A0AAD3SDV7_NEPGR|nr:hypothetical protein Nepgr_010776 [Nepenthes gracilis]
MWNDADKPNESNRKHFVSISMPPSPTGNNLLNAKRIQFSFHDQNVFCRDVPNSSVTMQTKVYSPTMSKGSIYSEAANSVNVHHSLEPQLGNHITGRDTVFDSFRTWPCSLERPSSYFSQKSLQPESEPWHVESKAFPVDRYYDALEGPELNTLRPSEELVLPEDRKWPFLLRYPISSFSICLGISSQAILWKALALSPSTKFLHVNLTINFVLWCISCALLTIVASIYSLKLIFYVEAARREYYHPVRVNFFFAPWIALLLLALGIPPSIDENLPHALWYVLMTPIFCLELKIYGQWMSGGQRRLSKVANPSSHIAIAGNFVGATLGASMGLKEGPLFFFAVGLAHYIVLFVTLYQRLPTNETLPKELHPIFFLFVVPPSVAAVAWAKIEGGFGYGSRIGYFIALFLYFSLAVRVNFFRGFRFSLGWWAYTVPMTTAAMATVKYSDEVTNLVTRSLVVGLSAVSTLTVTALLLTTIIHAFLLHDLFPNDITIAICDSPSKSSWKWFHLRRGSPVTKKIFHCEAVKSSFKPASPKCEPKCEAV